MTQPVHIPILASGLEEVNDGPLAAHKRSLDTPLSSEAQVVGEKNLALKPAPELSNKSSTFTQAYKWPAQDHTYLQSLWDEGRKLVCHPLFPIFLRPLNQPQISIRPELRFEISPTTPEKGTAIYKPYPNVCGGLIDMNSGSGSFVISEN
jgi:hypothetical protein